MHGHIGRRSAFPGWNMLFNGKRETSSLFRGRRPRSSPVKIRLDSGLDSRADNYRAVGIWVGQEAQHGSEGTGVDFVSNG